jgi:FtsP/CotA-like multicopper oxidase with cupredoxin domain
MCHNDFGGGGPRNPYGAAFEAQPGRTAADLQAIEPLFSDGDATDNIGEISTLFFPGWDCNTYTSATGILLTDLANLVDPADVGCASNPPPTTAPGAVAGGTLDPTIIPKYVIPLVIPPVMNNAGTANDYDIAVRQFQQQILPGGIWNTVTNRADAFPPTTVWSYGPAADPQPDSTGLGGGVGIAPAANSQFNYPAYTVENAVNDMTTVDWINDLVANPWPSLADDGCGGANEAPGACGFIPHLLPIDRSLHWANPEQLPCTDPGKTQDCRPSSANGTILQDPYTGPVPIVTHVHGAHVGPESDGYPEAWWLPNANNIPAGYSTTGTLVNQYPTPTNNAAGVGSFSYLNDQPSTTLWYHDHTLGMTRNNVYAGPAGFWLLRDPNAPNSGENGLVFGTLPNPAPVAGEGLGETNLPPGRNKYREIPIVVQDRSFNADGSLFYPGDRAFFEGLPVSDLKIPFIGDPNDPSDIAPIWNPEAFFNVMVVNGVSWPNLDVEPDLYRFRLLNGCNSRFINISLQALDANGAVVGEVPFYQIGAEQSLLPNVVQVSTGFKTSLPGDGTIPAATPAAAPEEALLMGLAERADVLVDFSNLPAGTVIVRMINTAPDAPFGGFPDIPADPGTTGQVMQFTVTADTDAGEGFTAPEDLVLSLPDAGDPANDGIQATVQDLALLEEESFEVCVRIQPNGKIKHDKQSTPDPLNPGTCVDQMGRLQLSVPFAPKAAVLGTNGSGGGTVQLWADPIAQNPALNATETWELWNWSADAHPIHLHLVKFKVVNRELFDPVTGAGLGARAAEATEAGWKDTVIAYPGEVTRVNATFDKEGLYVWHCHIVEHEDNEMMVPYCVGDQATAPGCNVVP